MWFSKLTCQTVRLLRILFACYATTLQCVREKCVTSQNVYDLGYLASLFTNKLVWLKPIMEIVLVLYFQVRVSCLEMYATTV